MGDNRFNRLEFDNKPSHIKHQGFAAPERNADDYLAKADHFAIQGDFENALRYYSRALEGNSLMMEAWAGQVRMLISLEEHPEAAVWADKAMEKFPDNPLLLALKAIASFRMGRAYAAKAACDAAIRQKGDLEFVWLCRGEIFLSENRTTAESCFAKALAASKNKGWTQTHIGEICLRNRKYSLALISLTRAVELVPKSAFAWYLLGKTQQALGMAHPARVSFQQAARTLPRRRYLQGIPVPPQHPGVYILRNLQKAIIQMTIQMKNTGAERFSKILKTARKFNASDIHVIAGLPPTFRIGGEIVVAPNHDVLSPDAVNSLAAGILNDIHKTRLEQKRELCISYHHAEAGRIRLSLYQRMGVTEMAIRMCNQEVKTIQELRLPAVLEELVRKTAGLIIITGPTGVGKTTTLNCLIDMINASKRCKIITIEDPVEFEHPHKKSIITQLEVGTDTNSFSACLRHVLRLDPDVIAIGEMRDTDTMETALAAAETGHLVIATLHTPSAVSTVDRIVSSFEGSRQPQITQQLASTLQTVIAQRLIPSVDKKDRILATELLVATDAVRTLIREEKRHQIANVITTSRKIGMHTLEHCLIELYQQGLITMDQAYAHANAPESLRSYFNKESRI